MSIELSVTMWPIMSLVLWFLAWVAIICIGSATTVLAYQTAREREWFDFAGAILGTSIVWFLQWVMGLYLNEWLKIVCGIA